jgi:hypothetical protein
MGAEVHAMPRPKQFLPLLLALPLAAVVLFLDACLPVGVGDPETSKVDPRLTGVWREVQDDGSEGGVVALLPFDSRAYVLRSVSVERSGDGIKLKPGEGLYKAWLATIEGRTIFTAQPLYLREAVGDARPPGFVVAALTLSEDGMKVEVQAVNPGFDALAPLKMLPGHVEYEPPAAGTKAPSEEEARALLRKVIAENLGKEGFFSMTARYERVTDKALLKAIFESVIG